MVRRPLPIANGCPSCGRKPTVRYRLFKGHRAECVCGVSGPYACSEWPEHDALFEWASVAGIPDQVRPPAPAPMKL